MSLLIAIQFWPAVVAVLLLVASCVRSPSGSAAYTRNFALILIMGSFAVCLALAVVEASDPKHNILIRDIAARAMIGLFIPALAVATLHLFRRSSSTRRALLALVASGILLLTSPLILIFVHCTSGDCL